MACDVGGTSLLRVTAAGLSPTFTAFPFDTFAVAKSAAKIQRKNDMENF